MAFNIVEGTAEIDETKNRYEVNHIIEGYVENEICFIDVPIEKDEAEE